MIMTEKTVKIDDIRIRNSMLNCIMLNIETGEISIYADSEENLLKAVDILSERGIHATL